MIYGMLQFDTSSSFKFFLRLRKTFLSTGKSPQKSLTLRKTVLTLLILWTFQPPGNILKWQPFWKMILRSNKNGMMILGASLYPKWSNFVVVTDNYKNRGKNWVKIMKMESYLFWRKIKCKQKSYTEIISCQLKQIMLHLFHHYYWNCLKVIIKVKYFRLFSAK